MNLSKTWGEWLTNHNDAEALDKNTNLVTAAAQQANNESKYVELLNENNGIAMMTKPAMENHVQLSFQHNHHGSSLLSQQKSLIAITGFDQGTPIEIESKHLHKTTNKTDSPSFNSILTTTDPANLAQLPTSTDNKIKFKSSVLLTPFLIGGLVDETDLSPANVFKILTTRIIQREEDLYLELKKNYKISQNIPDDAAETSYEPLRQDIRAETEQGYGDVVYFLYKLITN